MAVKDAFIQSAYNSLAQAIRNISENEKNDVYAISFWYSTDGDDPRYPTIIASYNTDEHYRNEIENASSETEARWNYAFWLQNDIATVGGEEDELLNLWLKETPYYYSDEDDDAASDDDALFERLMAQGDAFNGLFIEEIIALTHRLFNERVIEEALGRNVPVIIHELEYYDDPVDWTRRANPKGLADAFILAVNNGDI